MTDLLGKPRQKLGLHIHTTRSDGQKTPEQALSLFRKAGYDAVALTDHWVYNPAGTFEGMTVLSGCEYNVGGGLSQNGVFHIVGIGMQSDPVKLHPELTDSTRFSDTRAHANAIIDAIREVGGLAELAHPAWSLNTPEQIRALHGLYATEIYNTVSECGASNRPYSGAIVDLMATEGRLFNLLAVDDCHYYTTDHCVAYTMAEAADASSDTLLSALSAGSFYATLSPEVHLRKQSDGSLLLRCSPACRVTFMSNLVWAPDRQVWGQDITEAVYHPKDGELFVRAEVTDSNGKMGWSNPISLQ